MAERRMISKSISTSKKFGTLGSDLSRLLFLMIIPHTDDFGRLDGDTYTIKHQIIPTLNKTEKNIEKAIEELKLAGLINTWDVYGQSVIQVTNFDKHQQGLHKRTVSKYPDEQRDNGSSENVREIPGNSPRARGTELKGIEKNRTEENKYFCSEPKNVSKPSAIYFSFEDEKFHNITKKQIQLWKDAYPAVDISTEIRRAAAWMAANPAKKKKQWKRFLMGWLSRAQERGGTKNYGDENPIRKKRVGGGLKFDNTIL